MKTIQPGHEVLSVFGITSKQSTLISQVNKEFLLVLARVFLIILFVGALLSIGQKALSVKTSNNTAKDGFEPVAFQPSRIISQEILRGYVGN